MIRTRMWLATASSVTLLGLAGCSETIKRDTPQLEERVGSQQSQAALSLECPSSSTVDLQTAVDSVEFPLAVPSHEFASPPNAQEVCLEPSGRLILRFPPVRPAEEPLRADGLLLAEGWWYGGDPLAEYEGLIASYPELVGMDVYDIKGVPALGDPAHNSEDGLDRAYLTMVLGRGLYLELTGDGNGVEVILAGGESVEDLIAIAETLEIITH